MGYSLGFWLEDKSNTSPVEGISTNKVELHINYWSLEAKQACNYLDIGLRLELVSDNSFNSINFYFPFKMAKENYMGNLGSVICSTDELVELIFNERLKSSFEGVNFKDINFYGKENETLRLYKELDIGNQLTNVQFILDEENGSTRIKIPAEMLDTTPISVEGKTVYHYFRFRLRLTPEHVKILSQNYEPQDRLVVSKFEKIEVIDFRLNELRDLPAAVSNCLNKNFILEQIHFFLIRDIHDELKLSHAKYKRCRLLEKEVWNPYLKFKGESAILPEQMLIYHFEKNSKGDNKESKHIDRFNAFAKFVRVKVTFSNILVFIFSVIMLGAMGSLLATVFIESRPLGIYHWTKYLIWHILIGIGIVSIICCIGYAFWKNNLKFQWPVRRH